MFSFSSAFTRFTAMLFAVIFLIGAPSALKSGDRVQSPADCVLELNVVSDIHMETNNDYRKNVYVQTLRNMAAYTPGAEALVMCGDNTMNGFLTEYYILEGLTARLLPGVLTLPACGNHDVGNGNDDFDSLRSRFISHYNAYHTDQPIHELWYSRELNGCLFIALGLENNDDDDVTFSQTQREWFALEMERATAAGMPVIVSCHYPYNYLDDDMQEVIENSKNVYYFSGHLHRHGISVRKINNRDDLWNINLPRVTECDEDDGDTYSFTGLGVNLQITKTTATLNVYNFYTATQEETFTVPLV